MLPRSALRAALRPRAPPCCAQRALQLRRFSGALLDAINAPTPPKQSVIDFPAALGSDKPGRKRRQGQGRKRRQGRNRGGGQRRPQAAEGEYLSAQRSAGRYISTVDGLEDLCAAARESGRIAIDTEFHLEKTYFIELALVQIAVDGESYCVDPLSLRGQLEPLYDLVADPSVVKMLHAASMDLRVFYEHSRRPARNVFDTQIAAGLLGHGISAYSELVQMCTGVTLSKGSTMSDWLKRPLDDDQLRYAEDDVTYLAQVVDDLTRQLSERGRLEWCEEECAKLSTDEYYNSLMRIPEELFPRVKKVKSLSAEERVSALRLVQWREAEAAAQNKPPYFLLKDQALTEVAKLRPHSPDDLLQQASRLIHPNFARFNGKVIVALLNRPVTEPELEEAEVNTTACARPFSIRRVFTPMFRCVAGAALRAGGAGGGDEEGARPLERGLLAPARLLPQPLRRQGHRAAVRRHPGRAEALRHRGRHRQARRDWAGGPVAIGGGRLASPDPERLAVEGCGALARGVPAGEGGGELRPAGRHPEVHRGERRMNSVPCAAVELAQEAHQAEIIPGLN